MMKRKSISKEALLLLPERFPRMELSQLDGNISPAILNWVKKLMHDKQCKSRKFRHRSIVVAVSADIKNCLNVYSDGELIGLEFYSFIFLNIKELQEFRNTLLNYL